MIDPNGSWANLHRHRVNIGCDIKFHVKIIYITFITTDKNTSIKGNINVLFKNKEGKKSPSWRQF